MINESSSYFNGQGESNSELDNLEKRNHELAVLLEQQGHVNGQLVIQLDELKLQNGRLQQTLESERKAGEEKTKREIGALKEQLQVHIQTIGILVAEKTELQSSLNQNQKLAEARHSEVEELSGRLKASRQRVTDLERNFSSANTSSQKNEKSNKEMSKELEKLKMDLFKLTKSNEEFQQHNAELQGKLQQKITEAARTEDDLIELRGKLEFTELHIQQLQNGNDLPSENSLLQVDKLVMEKTELQTKLQQQEDATARLVAERDSAVLQYTQYAEQLRHELQNSQQQVANLTSERDEQLRRCRDLEATIDEIQTEHKAVDEDQFEKSQERFQLNDTIEKLSAHLGAVNKNLEVQIADNSQLSMLMIEKEKRIVELEFEIERLGSSTADKDKLLETIQSDKTALSRAVAQNRELKNQLTELQNGFVQLSTKNMEVTTQLQSEQHISKELAARLGHQEEELKEIREQLLEKEQLLSNMKRRDAERAASHRSELSSEELEDRLHEFQQQLPLVESLQKELSSAQDTINALTNQNSSLRSELIQLQQQAKNSDGTTAETNSSQVEFLSASVRQLEMERDKVIDQLRESQQMRRMLDEKMNAIQQDLANQVPATIDGDVITKVHFDALRHAMAMLEDKYTRVMREKADLVDKAENLEHIIMQLQGESDTIGEYVTLYQTQRSILRQRTAEKDSYIYQLAHERIEMQNKLGELQALVMQLLGERRMLHSYQNENQSQPDSSVVSNGASSLKRTHHKRLKHEHSDVVNGIAQEDWPDYSSSDDEHHGDSAIDQSPDGAPAGAHPQADAAQRPAGDASSALPGTSSSGGSQAAADDATAQRIMHLLNEIGTSNLVERLSYDERHFLHCNRCLGRLIMV